MSIDITPDESDDHRDRECPRCGSETEINESLDHRVCTNCPWEVVVKKKHEKGELQRISELEDLVGQLEERINELESKL